MRVICLDKYLKNYFEKLLSERFISLCQLQKWNEDLLNGFEKYVENMLAIRYAKSVYLLM